MGDDSIYTEANLLQQAVTTSCNQSWLHFLRILSSTNMLNHASSHCSLGSITHKALSCSRSMNATSARTQNLPTTVRWADGLHFLRIPHLTSMFCKRMSLRVTQNIQALHCYTDGLGVGPAAHVYGGWPHEGAANILGRDDRRCDMQGAPPPLSIRARLSRKQDIGTSTFLMAQETCPALWPQTQIHDAPRIWRAG